MCTYTKPLSWKYLWIAYAMRERTRNTAWKVFVLALKWGIVRKYSKEWRFFCNGYSGADPPSIVTSSACISKGCFACGVATRSPVTITAAPTFNLEISSKFSMLSWYTTCKVSKKLPSFITRKPKLLESRIFLSHPPIVIFLFKYWSVLWYNSFIVTNSIFLHLLFLNYFIISVIFYRWPK